MIELEIYIPRIDVLANVSLSIVILSVELSILLQVA